jgi:hypothetical protein
MQQPHPLTLLETTNLNSVRKVLNSRLVILFSPYLALEDLDIHSASSLSHIRLQDPLAKLLKLITIITNVMTDMPTCLHNLLEVFIHCTEKLEDILAVKWLIGGKIASQRIEAVRNQVQLDLSSQLHIFGGLEAQDTLDIVLDKVV